MGATSSIPSYLEVQENLMYSTVTMKRLPPSVDLRVRSVSVASSANAHSSACATLLALYMECHTREMPVAHLDLTSIAERSSKNDGSNPQMVVTVVNSLVPLTVKLERVDVDVKSIQTWLSRGRCVLCALHFSNDSIEEGAWIIAPKQTVLCCCIVGYQEYDAHFIAAEPTTTPQTYYRVPFHDFTPLEAFVVNVSPPIADEPLFLN